MAGVKSSGSKQTARIGQKYITERAGWSSSQGSPRTGSRRGRRMERQVRGRGGVDIWRSDCVLTSADADRFGREVPGSSVGARPVSDSGNSSRRLAFVSCLAR